MLNRLRIDCRRRLAAVVAGMLVTVSVVVAAGPPAEASPPFGTGLALDPGQAATAAPPSSPADGDKLLHSPRPVAGQYIVVLKTGVAVAEIPTVASAIAREHAGKLRLVFRNAFEGFSVAMTEERARALSRDPRVAFVEENSQIHLSATQHLPPDNSLYNLDRIDQLPPSLNLQYNYSQIGAGVKAYVIDTGVMASHQEFQSIRNGVTVSRAVRGYDAVPGDGFTAANPCDPNPNLTDAYSYNCGHGTGVASVLGGNIWGVAKSASIIPIRVFRVSSGGNFFGTVEDVIEGIDSGVLPDHSKFPGPAVANMSIYFQVPAQSPTTALETAVGRMINAGITVVASANNQNSDACLTSPARLARGNGGTVISVGGSMMTDNYTRDSRWVSAPNLGSNYGTCVDIFAPAHTIRAAHIETGIPHRRLGTSGTSFSSPHVAGVATMSLQNATTASPMTVWNTIDANSNRGRLASGAYPLNGSPDKLLYSNWSTQAPINEGHLDGASCTSIHGWAWDSNQPNSPINVDVYNGSTWLTTLWANTYRPDLVTAGKGNGYHGYGFKTPESLFNGQSHSIRVKYAGTDTNLFSSPRTLRCRTIVTTQTPTQTLYASPGYEVGTQFSSSVSGTVQALRFYRAPGEIGTNTLRLWTDTGTQLAVSAPMNSGTGWVTADIPDVTITAGTLYRVSVNTNTYQSKTPCGLSPPITNGPLTAHQGLWGQPMGAMPTNGSCSNYFVDVVFDK